MEIAVSLLIGYGFGLFQTGALYGKIKGVDLRHSGSASRSVGMRMDRFMLLTAFRIMFC